MDQPTPASVVYTDILQGLAELYDSEFMRSVARTSEAFPTPELANALNRNQLACKRWLLDALFNTLGGRFGDIWVLGGWYGVLAALMLDDRRFKVGRIVSYDIDPGCAEVALSMNLKQAAAGLFQAETADMHALDYRSGQPDLVINTSCEHIPDLGAWIAVLPERQTLVLQSNNYFREPDHISCVESLDAFKAQARLPELLFHGELERRNYTRFMLIGRT